MNRTQFRRLFSASLITLGVFAATSCASPYKNSTGLKQVDGLVSRVERVHVEGELAMTAVRDSVTSMLELVAPKGQVSVLEAFETFEKSIATSASREQSLKKSISDLQASGKPFFEGWNKSLDSFTSQNIRIQSRKRMEETRATYDRILVTSEIPLAQLNEFNTSLKDVALFLSRDFNPTSVRMIEGELRHLIETAGELDQEISKCLDECKGYTETSGLPARVQVEVSNGSGKEETTKQ
ncbi:MAG: DUF2959 family protein [Planctomycetes bacterium]|nr:DUF2959 family protein [Planctomycetota bacterium]